MAFCSADGKETAQITEKGVTLQMDFSLDFHLGQSTFRVYQARETVDLFVPAEGEEIPAQGEILLEQHYAEKHELQLGDIFIVGEKSSPLPESAARRITMLLLRKRQIPL